MTALALDRTLTALADPTRRRVVELLRQGPRAAGDLARETGVAPSALSRHLRTLKESGLVEEQHPAFDARIRIYSLKAAPMLQLLRWLEETERMWSEQLLAFKAHLEAGEGE